MSHVLEIRKRTAEERLRGDHIEMMFQLQQANDVIEDLLKQIKHLEQQDLVKNSAFEKVQDCGHQQEIDNMRSEILSLQSELKTLKTASQINAKTRKDIAKTQAALLDDEKAKQDRIACQYMMHIEDFRSSTAREIAILKDLLGQKSECQNCSEMMIANSALADELKKTMTLADNLESQYKVNADQYKKEVEILQEMLRKAKTDTINSETELTNCKGKIEALEKSLAEANGKNESLENHIHKLTSRKFKGASCQTDEEEPYRRQHEVNEGPLFVIEDDPLSSTFLTPSADEDVDARHAQSSNQRQSASFSSFPEYVAMKRENPQISPRDRRRQPEVEGSVKRRGSGGIYRLNSRTKSK